MVDDLVLPPLIAECYDDFLSGFVDAVQVDGAVFLELEREWLLLCPEEWREAFVRDAAEIEGLIDSGVFAPA